MSDQIDRANELAEKAREAALAKILQNQTACTSLFECEDCGEPIPKNAEKWLLVAPVALSAKPFTSISKKATADD